MVHLPLPPPLPDVDDHTADRRLRDDSDTLQTDNTKSKNCGETQSSGGPFVDLTSDRPTHVHPTVQTYKVRRKATDTSIGTPCRKRQTKKVTAHVRRSEDPEGTGPKFQSGATGG